MSTRYSDRDYDRPQDRDDDRYGRRSDYAYGETSRRYGEGGYDRDYGARGGDREYGRDYGRDYDHERDYGSGGGYGTPGYERDYGARYGRSHDYDYERGRYDYSEPSRRYEERYNYPSGYRSGETYGGRYGRDYDYGRGGYGGYGGRGEGRGWWDRATDEVSSWLGDEEAERRRRMDEQRARFRGRGPRGYRRSDERISEDINDRLSDDYYLDASDVEVSVDNGEVTLTGTVGSRSAKRRAEDIAESVTGVTNVENRIRVRQETSAYGTTGTATGTTGATGTAATAGAGAGTSAASRGRGTTTT